MSLTNTMKKLKVIRHFTTNQYSASQVVSAIISSEDYSDGVVVFDDKHKQKHNYPATKNSFNSGLYYTPITKDRLLSNYDTGNQTEVTLIDEVNVKIKVKAYSCDSLHGERLNLDYTVTLTTAANNILPKMKNYIDSVFISYVDDKFEEEEDLRIKKRKLEIEEYLLEYV